MARRVVYRATATSNQHSGSHDCFCTSVFSYTTCIILRRVTWRQAEMHLLSSSCHPQPNTAVSLWSSISAAVSPLVTRPRAHAASRGPARARAALIHQSGSDPSAAPRQKQLVPAGTKCLTNPVPQAKITNSTLNTSLLYIYSRVYAEVISFHTLPLLSTPPKVLLTQCQS